MPLIGETMQESISNIKDLSLLTKSLQVLYVEDNVEAREQTLKMLEHFFDYIDIAVDGADGLERYRDFFSKNKHYYDLVISDINMPHMDGLIMSKAIKEINASQHIIVISAYDSSDNLQECINTGVKNYLQKPIELSSLVKTLDKTTSSIKSFNESKEDLNDVKRLNKQISDLLNGSGQGFLSFDKDLKCEIGYSKECTKIFCIDELEGLNISNLLYGSNKKNKELLSSIVSSVAHTNNSDDLQNDLFLSLLPNEQDIRGRSIHIEYKCLSHSKFMLILTDITDKKVLKKQLEEQEKIQKMIVEVASSRDEFLALKSQFESFVAYPPESKEQLLRDLHSFKGNFAQKQMIYITEAIHKLETKLKDGGDITPKSLQELSLIFGKDLEVIVSKLKEKFLTEDSSIWVKHSSLDKLENKVENAIQGSYTLLMYIINDLLYDLKKLRYIPLKDMLNHYPEYIERLSKELKKNISPLHIDIDDTLLVSTKLRPFIESLIHIFNNSIDHGIENSYQRALLNKDDLGRVFCYVNQVENTLILEVGDDGSGLDLDKLVKSVIKKGLKSADECKLMSDQEKYELIFLDGITTSENITITSGRGVGMSALKYELDLIDGKVFIESYKDRGTTFKFLIPLDNRKITQQDFHHSSAVLSSLIAQSIRFIDRSCTAKVLSVNPLSSIDDYEIDECYTKIEFTGGYMGSYILGYSQGMKESFELAFIPTGFSEDETSDMLNELSNEIVNMIAGLSLKDFPQHLGEVSISTATNISKRDIRTLITDIEQKYIREIVTTSGIVLCILLPDDSIQEACKKIDNKELSLV
jgi:two-component system chemotaxis sensor kinase CheA